MTAPRKYLPPHTRFDAPHGDRASSAAPSATPHLTGAQAIEAIEGWVDLDPTKRRDLMSTVKTACRWAGHPGCDMPLTPAVLRDAILTKSAATVGVTPGRWSNVKAGLKFVLKRRDAIDDDDAPIPETWAVLVGQFGELDPRKRPMMAELARYCGAAGVAPQGVSDAMLADFEDNLVARSLRPKPRKFVGEVRGCWNLAAKAIQGWPAPVSARRPDPDQYVLPLADFTPAFQRSLAQFGQDLAANPIDDPFADDDGASCFDEDEADMAPLPNHRPLCQTTVENRVAHARWAASALAKTGVPIEEINDIRDLVQPIAHVHAILKFLYSRAGGNVGAPEAGRSSAGHHVANILRIIARHYARLPERDISKIERWGAAVVLHYDGLTAKNERTVREVLTPDREAKLLALPSGVAAAARKTLQQSTKHSPRGAVSLFMRALAVEMLTKLPNRLENLIELRLDQHLHRADPSTGLVTHIDVASSETKHKRVISVPVSRETALLIDEWERDYRPHMGAPGNPYLFASAGSSAKHITAQGMRDAVKEVMLRFVGVAVTPHQFRHIAAHMLLRDNPGCYGIVQQLLGHASVKTTQRAYCSTEQEAAVSLHDALLTKRLASLRADRRRRGGTR